MSKKTMILKVDRLAEPLHDDVIKWKHSPRYWPFVWGIHRSPMNYPHRGQWRGASMIFFDLRLNKPLSKQSWGWWFETQSRPLWRHVMKCMRSIWRNHVNTLGNITHLARLGKNIAHPFEYLRGKCSFWLIKAIFTDWRTFSVGSRHISVRFYVCETTRCALADLH